MSRVLLYASDDKLKAIEGPPGWLKRLDVRLTVGPPGASVTAGLRARDLQALQVMVDRADRTISKERTARSLADSIEGRPPPLFTFEGPAGRLADSGVLWYAGVGDGVGFLLAGSTLNAIARVPEQPGMLSPTADPVGTVQRFFESRADPDRDSDMAAYVQETVMSSTAQSGGLSAAPWIAGTAVYAGRIAIDPSRGRVEDSSATAVQNLIIGSPMWVAQVQLSYISCSAMLGVYLDQSACEPMSGAGYNQTKRRTELIASQYPSRHMRVSAHAHLTTQRSPGMRQFGRFPAAVESREDTYLLDPQLPGLSVKVRGGWALEVKVYRPQAVHTRLPRRTAARCGDGSRPELLSVTHDLMSLRPPASEVHG